MQKIYEAFRTGDRESAKTHVEADPALAIFAAAIFGDAGEIEKLLTDNRSLVNAVSPDGGCRSIWRHISGTPMQCSRC